MKKFENRHGVLHLYGHKNRPVQVRTNGRFLEAAGCGCEMQIDTVSGKVVKWSGPNKLKGVILSQIYYLWPELKERGQYQPIQLKPKQQYTIQLANALAITSLVLTWGGALVLAVLYPIETVTWSLIGLIQRVLLFSGIALVGTTYFDYWKYHEQYDARPQKLEAPVPHIEAEPEVMTHAELQKLWTSVPPLTMDNGEVYRIFDPQKVRQLRRLETRLGITLPLIEDSGWARVGVNEIVMQENDNFQQSKGRYQLPCSLSV